MGHSSRHLEDQNAKRNADSGGLAPEVSQGDKVSIGNRLAFIHTILAKDLASFCPCPKDLYKVELKRNGLICLEEEIKALVLGMVIARCSHLGLQC